jgi:hypothetical protein
VGAAISLKEHFTLNSNHLAEALKARDGAIADIDRLQSKITKLERHAQSASPAVAELNALREDSARSFAAAAAEDGELLAPAVDHKREAKLRDEIEAYRLSVESANSAISTLVAQRNAAYTVRDSAGRYATEAAVRHLIEAESVALFAAVNESLRTYVDLTARLDRLRAFTFSHANALDSRELRVAAENFDKARNATLVRPEPSPDSGEWHAKLAALLVGDKAEA